MKLFTRPQIGNSNFTLSRSLEGSEINSLFNVSCMEVRHLVNTTLRPSIYWELLLDIFLSIPTNVLHLALPQLNPVVRDT